MTNSAHAAVQNFFTAAVKSATKISYSASYSARRRVCFIVPVS